jgi:hypothetical protein
MSKFGRNYELTVTVPPMAPVVITPPFTVEFDIQRNTYSRANIAQFKIYNLGERSRAVIRKNDMDIGFFPPITFRAGYGEDLSLSFKGGISRAFSYREGVNWVTQIEVYDGGEAYVNGRTNLVIPKGTPTTDLLRTLVTTLQPLGVSPGVVGNYVGTLTRSASFSGNTVDILQELTGGGFFIDNGTGHALQTDEYISTYSPIAVIDATTGLLGTPQLENTLCRFDMVFEPRLSVGHKIRLTSSTGAAFNGDYKVTSIKHRGTISDSHAGQAVTTAEFQFFKSLRGVLA